MSQIVFLSGGALNIDIFSIMESRSCLEQPLRSGGSSYKSDTIYYDVTRLRHKQFGKT